VSGLGGRSNTEKQAAAENGDPGETLDRSCSQIVDQLQHYLHHLRPPE
jgi:hypothetical protein